MLALGFILTFIALTGIIVVLAISCDSEEILFSSFMGIALIIGIILIVSISQENDPEEISLKENTLEIQVKQEVVNGETISSDTIYIFTPKKLK